MQRNGGAAGEQARRKDRVPQPETGDKQTARRARVARPPHTQPGKGHTKDQHTRTTKTPKEKGYSPNLPAARSHRAKARVPLADQQTRPPHRYKGTRGTSKRQDCRTASDAIKVAGTNQTPDGRATQPRTEGYEARKREQKGPYTTRSHTGTRDNGPRPQNGREKPRNTRQAARTRHSSRSPQSQTYGT